MKFVAHVFFVTLPESRLLVLLGALPVVHVLDVLFCINSCRDEVLRYAIVPRVFFCAIV